MMGGNFFRKNISGVFLVKLSSVNLPMFLALIVLLSACATTTKVNNFNYDYQAKAKDCEMQFYKDDQPQKDYEAIGKIESHIKKNLFFGGKVQLEDEAFKELRIKACGLGGDAVIIDDSIETSAAEMTHVHVWATVIKYSN
jgi:hypothetical protein